MSNKIKRFSGYGNKVERITLSSHGLLKRDWSLEAFNQSCLAITKMKKIPDLNKLWDEYKFISDAKKRKEWRNNLKQRDLWKEFNEDKKKKLNKKSFGFPKKKESSPIIGG